MRAELKAIKTLLETNGLPMKQDTLDKVQKQLAGISALVDLWWQTVRHDLTQLAMTPRWTQWAEELLLPLMGFDHGVGHSLLVLCDAKAPHGKKWNDFKALENYLFIVSISLS